MSPRFQAPACASSTARMATRSMVFLAFSFLAGCANDDEAASTRATKADIIFIKTLRLEISIVPSYFPGEHHVFHACPSADVVDDQIALRWFVPDVDDDADVIDAATQVPRHDVAGQKSIRAASRCHLSAFAREKRFQIRHAPMIDIGIRSAQPPLGRIL